MMDPSLCPKCTIDEAGKAERKRTAGAMNPLKRTRKRSPD
jgi:hypothetical protein